MSIAYASTWEERLFDLGNIPPSRVLTDPPPGTASIEDVIRLRERDRRLVELVDRTLVEKAMGWRESFLASIISFWLNRYLENHRLGVVTGADGLTRLFGDTVRGPDVSFVAWDRLPNGKIPSTPVPNIVPNLVVEVLSIGNTYGEMSRKRREYFQAGVQLVWMVDPHDRSVTVFTGPNDWTIARDGETIDAGTVLPGFSIHTGDLFAKLDEQESQGRK